MEVVADDDGVVTCEPTYGVDVNGPAWRLPQVRELVSRPDLDSVRIGEKEGV